MVNEENKDEKQPVNDDFREQFLKLDLNNPLKMIERVFAIWRNWADFHLYITSPAIPAIQPPIIHESEPLSDGGREFVYPIHDHGYLLSTSKGEEMFAGGQSMCKLYYTIEKMIHLLIERLKSGGIDENTEVQVNFSGHLLAQRKAFESIINLPYNVIVNNFEPGEWGDDFLAIVKNLANKGYGYPSETPRDVYRKSHGSGSPGIKGKR